MIENPTAFPCPEVRSGGFGIREGSDGMSLRDWFAGQALAGLSVNFSDGEDYDHVAETAYRQADAMLAARKDA